MVIILTFVLALGLFHQFGRSIWHPLLVRVVGGVTVNEVMERIATKHPELVLLKPQKIVILCFKHERRVDVYCDHIFWKSFAITAASGTLGPKIMSGDRQVPEGVYRIDAVNPNSSYHLSLRVSYPNEADVQRSSKRGVTDFGGDIYIHGYNASIGCIALGNEAIEELFYVVNQMNFQEVEVIIAPTDFTTELDLPAENAVLYRLLRERITAVRHAAGL